MAEDQAVHLECIERAHQKLQEKHTKTCDDISQIMEMLAPLTKGKQNEGASHP